MLQKIKSSRKSKFKYLLLLPLLAFMLVVASCANDEQVPDSVVVTKDMPQPPMPPPPPKLPTGTLENEGVEMVEMHTLSESEAVPFSSLVNGPTFPDCEGEADSRACMNSKMTKHIIENFNTDLGKELGLEGEQRISTMFTIDASGDVTDIKVRGPRKELDDEAKRVIKLLPKFIPGQTVDGKKIGVNYTLPIRFEVE